MWNVRLILLSALLMGCERNQCETYDDRDQRVTVIYENKFVGLSLSDIRNIFCENVSIDEFGYAQYETNGVTILLEFDHETNGCRRVTRDIQYPSGVWL